MKSLRCQFCKQILYPWQSQTKTRYGNLHTECADDVKRIWIQDQRRGGV
jgi:hypothetical protein